VYYNARVMMNKHTAKLLKELMTARGLSTNDEGTNIGGALREDATSDDLLDAQNPAEVQQKMIEEQKRREEALRKARSKANNASIIRQHRSLHRCRGRDIAGDSGFASRAAPGQQQRRLRGRRAPIRSWTTRTRTSASRSPSRPRSKRWCRRTAFLVDQRKAVGAREVQSIGKPVLVIAPYLTSSLEKSKYLMVSGQLVKFAPGAVQKLVADYKLDLAPDAVSKYEGQPVLVATSVLDAKYAEIGRKPPPAATSDELAMSTAMKSISAAFATLRTASQASKTEDVVQSAATLQPLFTKVETAWDDIGQVPAAQLARDARGHAAAIQGAAAAGNWMAVQASATALNQVCGSCHGAYRERQDDGTFRFKPGSF
jgi:hypothetical protein